MSTYTPTIGLEIHAELNTRTKMFCSSANDPHASEPNTHVCPVCMAFPGTLPVINKEAVRHVLAVGAALDGTLADFTEFDRKNYFYPDLPKGYQISQFQYPLVSGGSLNGVQVTRVHLEEDTARSQHTSGNTSLIDFNRAGVPLMELVTEPVIHDAQTAGAFAQELQLLLRTLGVSNANMEKGEMRVEANISVSPDTTLGTKVEVKNLNSFRSVERAIEYEIRRHIELLEKGEKLLQETRGWDENKNSTFSQRVKENSNDYRYFPDPDLPKLKLSRLSEFSKENIANSLPQLPKERRERYLSLGIKEDDAETLVRDMLYGKFFDSEVLSVTSDDKTIRLAVNYLLTDVRGPQTGDKELSRIEGGLFLELISLIKEGTLTSRGGKDTLALMLREGGSPKEIADREGFIQIHDEEALLKTVETILDSHPDVVSDLKNGKESAIQFLIGQGMKVTKGAVNPKELDRIIKEKLGI